MKRFALPANRIAAFVLALVMTLSLAVGAGGFAASAYEKKTGVVATQSDSLTVRTGPGTSYESLGKLAKGTTVTIVDEAAAADGAIWYKIEYEGGYGYVHSGYIEIVNVNDDDADFESAISGFPDSYKEDLRTLHALYPNWVFKPVHTNTEWADAVAAECELGVSLVSGSSKSSWKSTQEGAYDWETGTWVELDSGGWVQASEEIVSYYLDPRNYLDGNYVFTFLDYAYDENSQTLDGLKRVVSGTFLEGSYTEDGATYQYPDVIMDVAARTKMNPYVIATIIRNEIGVKGESNSISGTVSGYEGYYNYYNIGAYAANGMTAIERGLWYAAGSGKGSTSYNRPWNSRTKALLGGAMFYEQNYVSVGQNTIYLKKFNVIGSETYPAYSHQYMTNVQGAASEGATLAKAYDDDARTETLIFEIPVFNNMPETACPKPTGDGSPNNKLSALSVEGYALTPGFSADTQSYDLVVDENTTQITISAKAMDATATISGTGTFSLQAGLNTFEVVVTAENGQKRTYEIDVDGSAAPAEPNPDPKPEPDPEPEKPADPSLSTRLTVNDSAGTISGLTSVPMAVADLTAALGVTNGTAQVVDAAGSAYTGNVGTGCRVQVLKTDGSLWKEYTVIVYGDVNGDGKFSSLDALRIQKHMVGMITLEGAALTAADANRDGKLNSVDALRIQKTVLNLAAITQ